MIYDAGSLTSATDLLQEKFLEIEGVDTENEGVDAENERIDNVGIVALNDDDLNTDRKLYLLQNPPNIDYNNKRSNQRSIGRRNLIVGARALHNVTMTYVNTVNAIATSVEFNPPPTS